MRRRRTNETSTRQRSLSPGTIGGRERPGRRAPFTQSRFDSQLDVELLQQAPPEGELEPERHVEQEPTGPAPDESELAPHYTPVEPVSLPPANVSQ